MQTPPAQSPAAAQDCWSFSLHAPAASQVRVSAGQESGSSADATTTQWPAWPAALQVRQLSAHALSQQTPSLQVSPAAHWLVAVHGAAATPFAWQLPPWQM